MFKKITLLFFSLIWFLACDEPTPLIAPLDSIFASTNPKIRKVLDSLEQYEVQIKFTQVERKNDQIYFTDYNFQTDSTHYFYPASTVKFPIAILALSKLNSIENIDRNSRFYVEGDTIETTFAREIEKIFAVSDNQSYNRLFEFLGQDFINHELAKINIGPVRIAHRFSVSDASEITTKPLIAYQNDSITTTIPNSINTSAKPLLLNNIQKGMGYMAEDSLIQTAFDFSLKNHYPIETQHQFLKTVMFPNQYLSDQKINLTKDQLDFVYRAMSTLPKNTGYDGGTYYDGYCKFFMFGDTKSAIPEHLKIYNKVGEAYGTLTDCAYVHDTKNNVEFLLTATILVNKNGVFNDDKYEYDEIGFPFLAELGRAFYHYELNR